MNGTRAQPHIQMSPSAHIAFMPLQRPSPEFGRRAFARKDAARDLLTSADLAAEAGLSTIPYFSINLYRRRRARPRIPYAQQVNMTFSPITRRIRHIQRYAQILEVLARHGFGDLSDQLGLPTLVDRAKAVIGVSPSGTVAPMTLAARLRTVLEELGPTYVKLGQVLSTRPDLVPQDWADEFKKLQNKVPGVDYAVVE